MSGYKELRNLILEVLDETEGDIHLQADGIIELLYKERLLTRDDDELDARYDDEEESDDDGDW